MQLFASLLALLLLTSPAGQTVDRNCSAEVPRQIPTVSFCELAGNPARYDGKIVRLKVRYLIGGETRVIYDKKCKAEAWVEFDHAFDACTEKSVRERLQQRDPSPAEGLFNGLWESEVVTVGMFMYDKREFGYINGYKYQFTMKWVDRVRTGPKKVA